MAISGSMACAATDRSPRRFAPRDDGGVCPRDDGKSGSPRNGWNTMWVLKKVPSPTQVTRVLKIIPSLLWVSSLFVKLNLYLCVVDCGSKIWAISKNVVTLRL